MSVLQEDYNELSKENDRLLAREAELASVVRRFASFFSSDDPEHFELLQLADGGWDE